MGGGWGSGPVRQAQSKRIRQPHGAHPLIAIAGDRDDGRIAEIAQHPAIGARRDELDAGGRQEARGVGKEGVSTRRSRWWPNRYKTKRHLYNTMNKKAKQGTT